MRNAVGYGHHPGHREGWTEERVERLTKLWHEGFSASKIAAELGGGVTRNAVVSKVHRLKIPERSKPERAAPRLRNAPKGDKPRGMRASPERRMIRNHGPARTAVPAIAAEAFVAAPMLPQMQELFIPPEKRLALLQLGDGTCRWPIGDPLAADFYFCGQHSEAKQPYCEFHQRRAYHPIEKKTR